MAANPDVDWRNPPTAFSAACCGLCVAELFGVEVDILEHTIQLRAVRAFNLMDGDVDKLANIIGIPRLMK